MDATLDEDFVNFEAFSQTCASTILASGTTDEDIRLLDNEARQRERTMQGDRKPGQKNNEEKERTDGAEMKPPSPNGAEPISSEYHLFTTFSYNSTSRKLTMIPVKYKIKEERRKVLKISVNKLKKIDDPESWLCRSVLINNTMKKLQRETREEKINKQMNGMAYSKGYVAKTADEFGCQLNNNNNDNNRNNKNEISNNNSNDNNNISKKVYRVEAGKDADCFYQKELSGEGFYKLANPKSEEFLFQVDKAIENEARKSGEEKGDAEDKLSISGGVPLNEDFVEKIPSIKRCASRKKSLDEDGTADEILNLNDGDLPLEAPNPGDVEDVDECDVHDVLSQLYMPPTPRMLKSMGGDAEEELDVVDIDPSYIDNIKSECQKLPGEGFFESSLLEGGEGGGGGGGGGGKKEREGDDGEGNPSKRRKIDDVFGCFNVCEESYDNFLCGNRNGESERTSDECRESGKAQEEELIELEDEEDIKRRLSQSLSSHYHRKPEKACENFFEDGCDNQYSCGHTITMFNDMQSVTFHNLIASLET